MAIQVKIPTILRTYTDGAKTVEASGATLSAVVDDLDAQHKGIKGRLLTDEGPLHRFVYVYVNRLAGHPRQGRRQRHHPARRRRRLAP